MSERRKVLVIDDEPANRELIDHILSDKFKVLMAPDGEEGIRIARSTLPDLVLLDISMPKLDGIAVCKSLRSTDSTRHIPIIMITAASDPDSRIQSFLTGADDFLAKPYRPNELIARVYSKMMRIEERSASEELLECGNLKLDLKKMEAKVGGAVVDLSVLEFNLLRCFVQNQDRVLSRERILETVWRDSVVSDRTVDTHVVSLRKRLVGFDHSLATVYGAGYILKKNA